MAGGPVLEFCPKVGFCFCTNPYVGCYFFDGLLGKEGPLLIENC
jgi:hypothetical protein